MDSVLDVSQPAYGQLQKLQGKDCTNEEVTAFTQPSQEARGGRMLLLQVGHSAEREKLSADN